MMLAIFIFATSQKGFSHQFGVAGFPKQTRQHYRTYLPTVMLQGILMIPKLFQWVIGGGAFVAVWAAILMEFIMSDLQDSTKDVVLFLPVFIVVGFAFYSIAVIGYRVATFNDCLAAAEELQMQVGEAKTDLKSKGFKFD